MSCINTTSDISKKCIEVYADVPSNCIDISTTNPENNNCEDLPIPEIEFLDSGGGRAEYKDNLFIAYQKTKCKLRVTNHKEIVDKGFKYIYLVCHAGFELLDDGTIIWKECNAPEIYLRTILFRFYKDEKCYTQRKITIVPMQANIIELTYDGNHFSPPVMVSTDPDFFEYTFFNMDIHNIVNVHIVNILPNVTSMEGFLFDSSAGNFTCDADTSNITNMKNMCSNSGLRNFPKLNTSNVTNMERMCFGCNNLTSFPELDTSKVTNLKWTWGECKNLTSFPEIDTSNVRDMSYAWAWCSSLVSFPQINTSNVTNMRGTWFECSSLTSFPEIDTSNVTNMHCTWRDCSSLSSFGGVSNCSAADDCTWDSTPLDPKPCGQS